jgi:YVTN family beta-propeller protein
MRAIRYYAALGAACLAPVACTDPTLPGAPGAHPVSGTVVANVPLAFRPFGIAVSNGGIVYATQLDNASMGAGSTTSLTLSGGIAVGNAPTAVAFAPSGTTAYVANQLSSNVGVVDVASSTQVSLVAVTGNTFNVIVSPNGSRVFVATNSNQVHEINASSRTVTGSVAVASAPSAMVFGKGDTLLYVSSFVGGTVTELNVSGDQPVVSRVYNVGGRPQGIAISPGRDTLYVANEMGTLDVVDIASGTITSPVNLGSGGLGLALTTDATQLYVTLGDVGAVSVVDRASLTIIKSITTGGTPRRIAFSPDGLTAVVASEAGSVVFIR